jgi:DNA-binding transcriptional MocR family regulator
VLSQEPPSAVQRARAALLAGPERSNRAIAALAGTSTTTVARARRLLAQAGLISGRAGRTPVPAIPALPGRPRLDGALCASHPRPGLWTSPRHADRAEAIQVCRQCPARLPCAQWALSLPSTVTGIYGGMMTSERVKARRELAAAG